MSPRTHRLDQNANYPPYFGNELDWIRLTAGSVEVGSSADDIPGGGDRWSTWPESQASERGPEPYPDWVVTELGAVDHELGVLKTDKEADVHLLRREVPAADRSC